MRKTDRITVVPDGKGFHEEKKMDYKRVKEENIAAAGRERKVTLLALLLVCIIAVQCIVIAVMWVSNYKYKVLYDEALETQLLMQQEINSLREESSGAPEDNQSIGVDNAETDNDGQAENVTQE